MSNTEQQFLKELDDKLWKAACKLQSSLDAANYKHIVLGLIFLKYVSDAFEERQETLLELFATDSDENIYYLTREAYDSEADYQQALRDELEVLDYYREANVFWVPKAARWNTLKEKAVLPLGTVLWKDDAGIDVKLRSVSWLVDNALEEIEKSNARLKGILNRISQYQLDNDKLLGLINTFSDTSCSFSRNTPPSRAYFLGSPKSEVSPSLLPTAFPGSKTYIIACPPKVNKLLGFKYHDKSSLRL